MSFAGLRFGERLVRRFSSDDFFLPGFDLGRGELCASRPFPCDDGVCSWRVLLLFVFVGAVPVVVDVVGVGSAVPALPGCRRRLPLEFRLFFDLLVFSWERCRVSSFPLPVGIVVQGTTK